MLTRIPARDDAPRADHPALGKLADAIERAIDDTPAEHLPEAVCAAMRELLPAASSLLSGEQLEGRAEGYTRHVLYAHPQGLFTVMALVWRPGQITPVHGHYTWCAYYILEGDMREEHFSWDAENRRAAPAGQVARPQGDAAASHAGMDRIHRLRNDSPRTAVSIHVYGVASPRVSTHVNRIAELEPA